jgi:hypothetical protein
VGPFAGNIAWLKRSFHISNPLVDYSGNWIYNPNFVILSRNFFHAQIKLALQKQGSFATLPTPAISIIKHTGFQFYLPYIIILFFANTILFFINIC